MQDNTQLARHELTLEQAAKLIRETRPDHVTVDLQWLANNIDYIREFNNFRIPIARNATSEEIAERQAMARQHAGYRVRPVTVTDPEAYVQVKDIRIKEDLKHEIREAYRRYTKQELETNKTHNKTTVFDPDHNSQSRIQTGNNEGTKRGEGLGSGAVSSGMVVE